MSEWVSINMPAILKPGQDPTSSVAVADSTRATSLHSFLKGEVIILDGDSDESVGDDELIGVLLVTVSKQIPSLISAQEGPPKAPRDVAMVHPSRLRHIGATATLGPSSPASVRSHDTPNHNTQVPEFSVAARISKSPPRAPKAMTPQVGNQQAPPTGPKAQTTPKSAAKGVNQMPLGIKSPPTGPKAQTTPRRSSKGTNSVSTGSPARSNPRGKPKRKKFIPLRVKLGGSASPSSIKKTPRLSDVKSSPQKPHVREHIPVQHVAPTGRQTPNGKPLPHPNSFRPSPKRESESFISRPRGSRPNGAVTNTHKAPLKVSYGAKRLAKGPNSVPLGIHRREKNDSDRILMPPPADTGLGSRGQEAFGRQQINYHGVPTGPRFPEGSPRAINGVDIPREQDYNFNLPPRQSPNTKHAHNPPKQSTTYSSPRRAQAWNTQSMSSFQEGSTPGVKTGGISASNKGSPIFEKVGYKGSVSSREPGEQESGQMAATMKLGGGGHVEPVGVNLSMNRRPILKRGGERPRNEVSSRGKLPIGRFQTRKKSYRNGGFGGRGAPPPPGAHGRGRLTRKLGHQDRATLGTGRTSVPENSVFKRNNRGMGSSGCIRHTPDLARSGEMEWRPEGKTGLLGSGAGDTERLSIIIDSDDDKKGNMQFISEKSQGQLQMQVQEEQGQGQEEQEEQEEEQEEQEEEQEEQEEEQEEQEEEQEEQEEHQEEHQEVEEGVDEVDEDQEMQELQNIQGVWGVEVVQGVQGIQEQQDADMRDGPQVITIDDDVEGESEEHLGDRVDGEVDANAGDGVGDGVDEADDGVDGDEDVEMGEIPNGTVDLLCHNLDEIDQASSQTHLQNPDLNPGKQPGEDGDSDERGGSKGQEPVPSGRLDIKEERWKLPPYQHSPGRPTVPMHLFEFVIIERLEQVALSDIFYSIRALEEEKDISHRVTVAAFNDILVRSYLKVRDMMMRDPLLDVDQEACEQIARGELDSLLAQLDREEEGDGREVVTIENV